MRYLLIVLLLTMGCGTKTHAEKEAAREKAEAATIQLSGDERVIWVEIMNACIMSDRSFCVTSYADDTVRAYRQRTR